MPHDFQVYSSVEQKANANIYSNQKFPPFPFIANEVFMNKQVDEIANMEQIEIMNELVKHSQNANIIKENTRDYGDNSNWFELRKL